MSAAQRVQKFIAALGYMGAAALMLLLEDDGYELVLLLLGFSLILQGFQAMVFYFTMARHMVDGRSILYKGVILLDFGIFTLSITQRADLMIALYLLGLNAFSGAVDIMRALEARRFQAASWRLNLAKGILNISFAALAVAFGIVRRDMRHLTWVYASGLFYSGVLILISAFRKTAIVYIQ